MRRSIPLVLLLLAAPTMLAAQTQDVKLPLDTVAVQAEGTYEADPDLATLTFVIYAEDKRLTRAYELATEGLKRITELAERHNVVKSDVSSSVFSVTPDYDGKRKPRSYKVHSTITVKIRDINRVAFVIDDAVESGVAEFRSAVYSLEDEEAAKQKAVAEAMRLAQQRARAAVGENGRQLGELRHASLDIQVARMSPWARFGLERTAYLTLDAVSVSGAARAAAPPPPPPYSEVTPEKVRVTATAQCVFQIQ